MNPVFLSALVMLPMNDHFLKPAFYVRYLHGQGGSLSLFGSCFAVLTVKVFGAMCLA